MNLATLKRNPDATSSEDFGDEVVVIHHESGVFYSIKGRAMAVWRGLEAGIDAGAFDAAAAALDAAEAATLRTMLDELAARGIVTAAPGAGAAVDLAAAAALGAARFETNCDFDDLIRLDPIHDVSEAGWPHRRDGHE